MKVTGRVARRMVYFITLKVTGRVAGRMVWRRKMSQMRDDSALGAWLSQPAVC